MELSPLETIIYALVPLIAALIKQSGWSAARNAVVATLVYAGAAVATVALGVAEGGFTVDNLVVQIAAAATIGTVAYNLFWKNVGDATLTDRTSVVKPE